MTRTHKYLLAALAWLIAWPFAFVLPLAKGLATATPFYMGSVSVIWWLGLVACFGLWTWADAPTHGKPRTIAAGFTALSVVLLVLAVPPYLFVTRGARGGLRASLVFAAYCAGCVAVFIGVGMVSRMFI